MTELKDSECYIDVWKDANFEGERLRVYGPVEYPHLRLGGAEWGDQIGSLRVGPRAFVLAYCGQDFKDRMVTFGPLDEIADLVELQFDDEIDSLKVIDSMKILDRLPYKEEPPQEPPAAPASEGQGWSQPRQRKVKNRHKGRHR